MSIYAVNGKVPVAAWIPSRDTVGNGTTTLNDLVGTNHGTLTNMDPATDWVSDTGAGGVRALDFDGANDFVRVPHSTSLNGGSFFSLSCWVRTGPSVTTEQHVFSKSFLSPTQNIGYRFYLANGTFFWYTSSDGAAVNRSFRRSTAIATNTLYHVCCVFSSSSTLSIFLNGSLADGSLTGTIRSSVFATTSDLLLGAQGNASTTTRDHFAGHLDDIRIFNVALDASDVSYLWHSGNGRGRIATPAGRLLQRRTLEGGYASSFRGGY